MNEAEPAPPRRRRRWPRTVAIVAAALVLPAAVLVALLPTLASTGLGTRAVAAIAGGWIDGDVAIDDLSVGWFSETRVTGLTLTDPEGQTIVRVGELVLPQKSLLDLLRSSEQLGPVRGRDIDVNLVRYEDGSTNLDRAVGAQRGEREKATAGPRYSADVQLQNVRVSLAAPGIEPVRIDAPTIKAELIGMRQLDLDVDATVSQGELTGRITAAGGVTELSAQTPAVDLRAQVQSLPIAAVDQLLAYDGKLVTLLGDTLDAELLMTGTLHDADLHIGARSPNARAELPLHLSSDALTNTAEGSIRLTVTPAAYSAWVGGDTGQLLEPVALTINLRDLQVPMADGSPVVAQARVALDLAADALRLRIAELGEAQLTSLDGSATYDAEAGSAAVRLAGPFQINQQSGRLDLDATVAGLNEPGGYTIDATLSDLPVPIVDQLAQQDGRAVALLGNTATVHAVGSYPGDLTIQLQSSRAQLEAPLSLTDEAISLRSAATASATIDPAGYRALVGERAGTLSQPVTLRLTVNQLRTPMTDGRPDFAALQLDASLNASALALDVPDVGDVRLDDLQGGVSVDRAEDRAALSLRSPLTVGDQTGQLDAQVRVAGLSQIAREIDATITNLPVAIVDQFAQQDGRALALLGPTATVTAAGSYPGDLNVQLQSPNVRLDAPLSLTGEAWSVRGPASANLKLSPQDYARLVGTDAGRLTGPLIVALDVNEASVPLTDGQPDWSQLRADVALRSEPVEMTVPQVGPMALGELAGTLRTDRATDTIALKLQGPITANEKPGTLDASIKLGHAASGPPYRIDATLTDVPVPLIDAFAALEGQATELVGPTATLTAAGAYPGDLALTVRSRSVQADAPLHIGSSEEGRVVTLTKNLTAQLSLNEASTRTVLGKLHPVIADAVASEKPARLVVQAEGFALPLRDFAFEKVRAQGTIDLGTLTMSRRGWLQQGIGAIAEAAGVRRRSEAQTYLATFTPAQFTIADGRVSTTEMWLTSDDMAIGFRGRADVPADRFEFDMGILGATLVAQYPKIGRYLPAGQVFTLPVAGSLDKPRPDIKPVVTQVLILVAQHEGGDIGRGLGLLGRVMGNRNGGADAASWSPPAAAQQLIESLAPAPEPATASPTSPSQP